MSTLPDHNTLTAPHAKNLPAQVAAVLSGRVPLITQTHVGVLCGAATLLSAFLVFQVQPIVGKTLLPWFGGGHSVWTTCLVFFQVALLAGYAYAHLLAKLLTTSQQAVVHTCMVFLAFLFLPLVPAAGWSGGAASPGAVITLLLLTNVAAPYVLLAATSPLMQSWYATVYPRKTPYRLYALSNLGSLVALLSYPFLVEPMLGVTTQSRLWSIGFVIFAIASTGLALAIRRSVDELDMRSSIEIPHVDEGVRILSRIKWIGLAALGSMSLIATSNHISYETTVSPLLWLAPLSMYLVTFIIAFERPQWYAPRWWGVGCAILMLMLSLHLCITWTPQDDLLGWFGLDQSVLDESFLYRAALGVGAMFFLCQLCHGELYRCRPSSQHLTAFYLHIAAGGALGGMFVAIVCPLVFSSFMETKLMIGMAIALALWLMVLDGQRNWRVPGPAVGLLAGVLGTFAVGLAYNEVTHGVDGTIYQARNFYGVIRVEHFADQTGSGRGLYHGGTLHGFQYGSPEKEQQPTTYYARDSGVGIALAALSDRGNLSVGAVGLGVGTVATYGRPGDRFHFFEIDPLVSSIASNVFTFLENSQAETKITLGDARISMEREPSDSFDLLILDAFTGDAVPAHLLTLEAFDSYERLLTENGVIAVHISNRVLNLLQVVAAAADHLDMPMVFIETDESETLDGASSKWVLMSHDASILISDIVQPHVDPHEERASPPVVWTDERNSLLSVIY
jgi:hypothetical protein